MIPFAASLVLLAGIVMATFHYWERLAKEIGSPTRRWLIAWVCKGVGVPMFLWFALNSGIVPGVPSLMTDIELARAGGGFGFAAFLRVMAPAVFVIGSYWAAVSFGWLLTATVFHLAGENRSDFIGLSALCSVALVPVALLVLYFNGWGAVGLAAMIWLIPVAHLVLPLAVTKKLPPMYSRAVAKMKFGKYKDAEWEIIKELEAYEDDFEGWMMLAELHAIHFNDLDTAGQVIQELCTQPNLTGSQISVALHRLADWHLKVGADPVSARRALAEICQRFPGSHVDRMASLRINQLPADREELRERQKGRTIHLPALADISDEAGDRRSGEISEEQAIARANQYVERLRQDPDNVQAREELARIFAEQVDRIELAIEQLELLVGMPGQPAQKRAEWLSLMAAWQIKYHHNLEAGGKLLERVIQEFPQSPQAFAAQRRLNLMEVERKLRKARTSTPPSIIVAGAPREPTT